MSVDDTGIIDLYWARDERALTETERKILSALESGERLADDVIAETGLPTGQVLATLTLLEVKGLVRRLPGRRITLR